MEMRDIVMLIITALGVISWGFAVMQVKNIVARLNDHGKRIGVMESKIDVNNALDAANQKVIEEKLTRIQKDMDSQSGDIKTIGVNMTNFVMTQAKETGELFKQIISLVSHDKGTTSR